MRRVVFVCWSLVSKKVLDPTVWSLENFTNEELLRVCKDSLKEQQGKYHAVDQPFLCILFNVSLIKNVNQLKRAFIIVFAGPEICQLKMGFEG